jgi:hypothetical protein
MLHLLSVVQGASHMELMSVLGWLMICSVFPVNRDSFQFPGDLVVFFAYGFCFIRGSHPNSVLLF